MGDLIKWLQQLISTLILVGFLEMLLPENGLKKVTKLVMGLIVMMILIQPLVYLFKIPLDIEDVLSGGGANSSQMSGQLLSQGLRIRNTWNTRFNLEQNNLVKEKIESVIGLIDEVEIKNIQFETGGNGQTVLVLGIIPINEENLPKTLKDKLEQKIKNSVRLVSNLSKEQIEVVWHENG